MASVRGIVKDLEFLYVNGSRGKHLTWAKFSEIARGLCKEKNLNADDTDKVLSYLCIRQKPISEVKCSNSG